MVDVLYSGLNRANTEVGGGGGAKKRGEGLGGKFLPGSPRVRPVHPP